MDKKEFTLQIKNFPIDLHYKVKKLAVDKRSSEREIYIEMIKNSFPQRKNKG